MQTLQCPHCQSMLRTQATAGNIRCPKCQGVFPVNPVAHQVQHVPQTVHVHHYHDDEPRGSNPILKLGCLLVIVFLAGLIVVGIMNRDKLPRLNQTADKGGSAEEQDRVNRNLEKYMDGINESARKSGGQIVRTVAVKGDTATVTVENHWHLMPYQLRLQAAQALWKRWANIASPSDLDKARISFVDLSGNEVGGSRWTAGSLIWVQDR